MDHLIAWILIGAVCYWWGRYDGRAQGWNAHARDPKNYPFFDWDEEFNND